MRCVKEAEAEEVAPRQLIYGAHPRSIIVSSPTNIVLVDFRVRLHLLVCLDYIVLVGLELNQFLRSPLISSSSPTSPQFFQSTRLSTTRVLLSSALGVYEGERFAALVSNPACRFQFLVSTSRYVALFDERSAPYIIPSWFSQSGQVRFGHFNFPTLSHTHPQPGTPTSLCFNGNIKRSLLLPFFALTLPLHEVNISSVHAP